MANGFPTPSIPDTGFKTNNSLPSPPVGSDILPGGNTDATTIRDSLIFSDIIPFVIQYAIGLAMALSVIALILGGYQYLTAYGNPDQHTKAQKTIIYAIIGLILSLTAYGIVRIVTSIQLV